jgi:ATP-binding cassette subfamily B protein
VILGGLRGRRVRVLTPDLKVVHVSSSLACEVVCQHLELPHLPNIERLIARAGLSEHARRRARRGFLHALLPTRPVGNCWLIRPTISSSAWKQAKEYRLGRTAALFLAAHAVAYGLSILSWQILGSMAIQGRFDPGWLHAWLLILFTMVPLNLLQSFIAGRFWTRVGILLKRRLLLGALKMDPNELRPHIPR